MSKLIFLYLNLLISLSLEAWGLYFILGVSPYLAIAVLIGYFKVAYKDKKLIILFILTFFFAIQKPFLQIVKKEEIDNIQKDVTYLEKEIETLNLQNEKYITAGAWGLSRDTRQQITKNQDLLFEIKNNNQDLLNANKYISFIQILIIFLVEYMLYIQLRNLKTKRKYTKRSKKNKELKGVMFQ